jgi:hypothetical protein
LRKKLIPNPSAPFWRVLLIEIGTEK